MNRDGRVEFFSAPLAQVMNERLPPEMVAHVERFLPQVSIERIMDSPGLLLYQPLRPEQPGLLMARFADHFGYYTRYSPVLVVHQLGVWPGRGYYVAGGVIGGLNVKEKYKRFIYICHPQMMKQVLAHLRQRPRVSIPDSMFRQGLTLELLELRWFSRK